MTYRKENKNYREVVSVFLVTSRQVQKLKIFFWNFELRMNMLMQQMSFHIIQNLKLCKLFWTYRQVLHLFVALFKFISVYCILFKSTKSTIWFATQCTFKFISVSIWFTKKHSLCQLPQCIFKFISSFDFV